MYNKATGRTKNPKSELLALLAANDHHPKSVVAQIEPLNKNVFKTEDTTLGGGELDSLLGESSGAEKLAMVNPQIEDGIHLQKDVGLLARYTGLVKCQQCEHLTFTGECKAKPLYKPMPDAMRDCEAFNQLKTERTPITDKPYTQKELGDLMARYEKRLFHHLVKCELCLVSNHRYCVDGFAIGNAYEAMLLCFNDAELRHDNLITRVVKERLKMVSSSVYEVFGGNAPPPNTKPVKEEIEGHSKANIIAFLKHYMNCKTCKPKRDIYCLEGQQLHRLAEAD